MGNTSKQAGNLLIYTENWQNATVHPHEDIRIALSSQACVLPCRCAPEQGHSLFSVLAPGGCFVHPTVCWLRLRPKDAEDLQGTRFVSGSVPCSCRCLICFTQSDYWLHHLQLVRLGASTAPLPKHESSDGGNLRSPSKVIPAASWLCLFQTMRLNCGSPQTLCLIDQCSSFWNRVWHCLLLILLSHRNGISSWQLDLCCFLALFHPATSRRTSDHLENLPSENTSTFSL